MEGSNHRQVNCVFYSKLMLPITYSRKTKSIREHTVVHMAKQGLTGRGRSFLEVVKGSFQVALHILAHVILADKQG